MYGSANSILEGSVRTLKKIRPPLARIPVINVCPKSMFFSGHSLAR